MQSEIQVTPGADMDALMNTRHTFGFKLGDFLDECFDKRQLIPIRLSVLGFMKPDGKRWKL